MDESKGPIFSSYAVSRSRGTLQRPADKDWKSLAEDIFTELYHEELVGFIAMSKYQNT
ncbi:hypothetical protein CC79DRAFT_1334216 [Sarocladium strictum]